MGSVGRWLSESESYLIEEVSTNFLLKCREGESTLADDRSEDISTLQSLQNLTLLFETSHRIEDRQLVWKRGLAAFQNISL